MDSCFLDGLQRQHVHILGGRSGTGKTQVALQYAKTRKRFFSDIIFVDASSRETIRQSYTSFIISKDRGSTLEDSLRWLSSSSGARGNWLIIFDGADSAELELRSLLPSCAHGNIIVTTRRNDLPSPSEWPRSESRLTGLNHEDALDLLAKVAEVHTIPCSSNKHILDMILKETHYFALPITLAGVYLRKRSCDFSECCRLYCKDFQQLLMGAEDQPSKSKAATEAACSIILHRLSAQGLNILRVLAFMHHRGISTMIFQRATEGLSQYTSTLPPTDTETRVEEFLNQLLSPLLDERGSWNGDAFRGLMAELLEYSLLYYDEQTDSYTVIPRCMKLITGTQGPDQEFMCRVATHLLALSVDSSSNSDYEEQSFRQMLAPHVDCVLLRGESISLDDAVRFALVYLDNDQLDEAEVLQLEVVEFRRRILGETHQLTLESKEQLAIINRKQGKLGEGDDASLLLEDDYFPMRTAAELYRKPRVTRNRISISLQKITADTPLDVIVKYFTLVAQLRDLTAELNPGSTTLASYGGLGNVYRAALKDNTRVAIKCIRQDWSKLENKVTKYTAREIATWNKLVHPNILEFLGLALFQDQLVMVSPWMPYGNVVDFVNQRGGNRCSLSLQLTSAVAYMHSLRVVHGDIKGANTLVSEDGVVKLADFGLTIVRDATLEISITNKGGGTVRWMAPELFLEESAVRSETADIYALGMTFLEIFTGHRPFRHTKNEVAVMSMVTRREGIKRPGELSVHTEHGDHVWNILQQCWKWDPKERPSANQVKALLYEIM